MIDEATRVTMTTSSLTDHIVTNKPEKISDSGVIHTDISRHIDKQENILEIRNLKNFNEEKLIEDLLKQPWEHKYFSAEDPNAMWEIWKKKYF